MSDDGEPKLYTEEELEDKICEESKPEFIEEYIVPVFVVLGLSWLIEVLLHHLRGSIPFITEEESEEFAEDRKRRGIIAIIIAGIAVAIWIWYVYTQRNKLYIECEWAKSTATKGIVAVVIVVVAVILYHRFVTDGINGIPPPPPPEP